jgi:hypothetical protein
MDIMTKAVVGNSCRIRSFTQFEIKTRQNGYYTRNTVNQLKTIFPIFNWLTVSSYTQIHIYLINPIYKKAKHPAQQIELDVLLLYFIII